MRSLVQLAVVGSLLVPGVAARAQPPTPEVTPGEEVEPAEPTPPDQLSPEGIEAGGDAQADAAGAAEVPEDAPVEESGIEVEQEPSDPSEEPPRIRYFLEAVEVEGNTSTRTNVVRRFVPIEPGGVLDVDDPAIETIRWRLLGTGFFNDVRLRLRRGSRRGWVILVIEVEERNTLVIQHVALGLSQGVRRTSDTIRDVLPYGGLTVAETNLLGLGMQLSLSGLASKRQQGVRGRFTDPLFLGSNYLFSTSAFFSNGLEFFGDDPLVAVECPELDPGEECPPEVAARNAVVLYKRYGLSLGIGHDIGAAGTFTLDWQGELVDVSVRPDAASEMRGDAVEPIDFDIRDGLSFVSVVQFGVNYDRRNNPALPSQGVRVRFVGDVSGRFIGSEYSFLRLQVQARAWQTLPGAEHHLRFGAYAGAIFGDAPFFYKFFVSDLSDLIPSRILQMNIDGRRAPNLLGTSVAEMRSEELAARLDVEYSLSLYRGDGGLRAVNAYLGAGLFTLADRDDLRVAIPGYDGISRIPMDLTFDVGVRADTSVGVFHVGFSTLLGFVPVFSE